MAKVDKKNESAKSAEVSKDVRATICEEAMRREAGKRAATPTTTANSKLTEY